jgi:hypothetical protein
MGAILAKLVKAVAEGRFGRWPARVYWYLAGKKTITGLVLGTAYVGLTLASEAGICSECSGWAQRLAVVSVALVAAGLLDRALREDPPHRPMGVSR